MNKVPDIIYVLLAFIAVLFFSEDEGGMAKNTAQINKQSPTTVVLSKSNPTTTNQITEAKP
jgi:hypothetical protein